MENHHQFSAFLIGLCGLLSEQEIKSYLSTYIEGVSSITLPNKRKAGFAFVHMKDKASLETLLGLKSLYYDNRKLLIRPFRVGKDLDEFRQEANSRRLFVSSIPKTWTDQDLKQLFSRFGELEGAYVIRDRATQRSKCFGYVIYVEKHTTELVAKKKSIKFNRKILRVKLHERKQKKSYQLDSLQSEYHERGNKMTSKTKVRKTSKFKTLKPNKKVRNRRRIDTNKVIKEKRLSGRNSQEELGSGMLYYRPGFKNHNSQVIRSYNQGKGSRCFSIHAVKPSHLEYFSTYRLRMIRQNHSETNLRLN